MPLLSPTLLGKAENLKNGSVEYVLSSLGGCLVRMSKIWLVMNPGSTTGALYPPIADGEGTAVNELAPSIAEA